MPDPELTEERIAEAMARAEKVACAPGDQRCLPLRYDVESALATCTPKGRCKVGWSVANAGRDSWNVWRDLASGRGRGRDQPSRTGHIPFIRAYGNVTCGAVVR